MVNTGCGGTAEEQDPFHTALFGEAVEPYCQETGRLQLRTRLVCRQPAPSQQPPRPTPGAQGQAVYTKP